MRKFFLILCAASLLFAFAGACSNESRTSYSKNKKRTVAEASTELPLPTIPETLTSAQERGSFLAVHFWDALDSLEPAIRADTVVIEQSFANYIGILQYVSEETKAKSVGAFLAKCIPDPETVRLIEYLAQKYLDDPNSPMRSEDLYLHFLRNFSANQKFPEDVRLRSEFHLKQAMKNRPGDKVADFSLITRDGVKGNLYGLVAPDTTIIMFYDPDCSQCQQITERMAMSTMPYRILAVDVAGDRRIWDKTKHGLPADWQVAYAVTPVEDEDLYVFPALPSFYLVEPNGKVILKDFTIQL